MSLIIRKLLIVKNWKIIIQSSSIPNNTIWIIYTDQERSRRHMIFTSIFTCVYDFPIHDMMRKNSPFLSRNIYLGTAYPKFCWYKKRLISLITYIHVNVFHFRVSRIVRILTAYCATTIRILFTRVNQLYNYYTKFIKNLLFVPR